MIPKIDHININLPNICNMACKYCFHKDSIGKMIPSKTFVKDIESILNKMQPYLADKVLIDFVGGEVLIQCDLLNSILKMLNKYPRNHNVKFYYKITTNGSMIDELIDYIDREIFDPSMVGLSYDGDITDRNLIPFINLEKILSKYPTINIHIALTYNSILYLQKTINELYNLGSKNIEYYYLYENTLYKSKEVHYLFKQNLDYIMQYYVYPGLINLYNYEYTIERYKEYKKSGTFIKGMNCSKIKNIDILPDGTFSPCANLNAYMIGSNKYSFNKSTDIKIIENSYNLIQDFYKNYFNCGFPECGNYQCTECSLYSYQHRDLHEQCDMRTIEREVFEKYIRRDHKC